MHAIDPYFFWSFAHNIVERAHIFEQMSESVVAIAKMINLIAHYALIVSLVVSIVWLAIYGWNYWQERKRASQTIYQNQGFQNPTIAQIRQCLQKEAGENHHWQRCPELSNLPYGSAFYNRREFVTAAIDHQVQLELQRGFVVRVDEVVMHSVAALRQTFQQRFEYRFPPVEWIRKKVYGDSVSELLCYCQQNLFRDVTALVHNKLSDNPKDSLSGHLFIVPNDDNRNIDITLDNGEERICASCHFYVNYVDDSTKDGDSPRIAKGNLFVNVDLIKKVNWIGYTIDGVF